MEKPANPYKKGTLIWSVMEGDWEDLTVRQIAEVLNCSTQRIYDAIGKIGKETGYIVQHAKAKRGRPFDE